MTPAQLERIKSALRESIEIANKATEGPWKVCEHSWQDSSIWSKVEDKTVCHLSVEDNEETADAESVIRDANATFLAHARTMTPLACKGLLLAIAALSKIAKEKEPVEHGYSGDGPYTSMFRTSAAIFAKQQLESILAAFPLELIQKP